MKLKGFVDSEFKGLFGRKLKQTVETESKRTCEGKCEGMLEMKFKGTFERKPNFQKGSLKEAQQ